MQSFSLLGVRKEIVIMGVIKLWYVWQIKISYLTAQHSPSQEYFFNISMLFITSFQQMFLIPHQVHHMGQCGRGGLRGDRGPGHLF